MSAATDNHAPPRVYDAIIARLLSRSGRWNGAKTELAFRCLAHDDDHPSASFNTEKQAWYCHSCKQKGGWIDLCKRLHIEWREAPSVLKFRKIVATYDYCDETGALLYQAVRFVPKGFSRRRPNGDGGWVWDLHGIRRVLYHLPELLKADPTTLVVVVEGEKDADRLKAAGVLATTSVGGAEQWQAGYAETLRGRHVAILPDNDKAGEKYAHAVLSSLLGVAASVRVVSLPGLPEKGDVSDFLDTSDVDKLLRLIEETPEAQPTDGYEEYEADANEAPTNGHVEEEDIDNRPRINAGEKDLPVIRALAWDALMLLNTPTPSLFCHGGQIVRFGHDDHEWPQLTAFSVDGMVHALSNAKTIMSKNRPIRRRLWRVI